MLQDVYSKRKNASLNDSTDAFKSWLFLSRAVIWYFVVYFI